MDDLVNQLLQQELENEIRRDELILARRTIRDQSNPFEMPNSIFTKYYRFSKEAVRYIVNKMEPHLRQSQRISSVPIEHKVLMMIYFCAHGNYQKCAGQNHNMPVEQSTVSRIITETTNVVCEHLVNEFVKFPQTVEEEEIIKRGFYEKYRFPGTVGAVDGTHVAIIAPPEIRPGNVYYNRKGYYSLNVQMICDADMRILNCNARFPGSVHDSAICSLSSVKQYMVQNYRNDKNTWLIGDSGYPLEPCLLTPIENAAPGSPAERYTSAFIRARACIERCFGCLKQRFRCLLKHRVLHYKPQRAAKIITACTVLHNIALATNVPDVGEPIVEAGNPENQPAVDNQGLGNNQGNLHAQGLQKRNFVIQNYFTYKYLLPICLYTGCSEIVVLNFKGR